MQKTIPLILLSIAFASSAQAGSIGTVNAASETTQYLNYGELYSQTNTVMSQLQTQMEQLANLQRQVTAGSSLDWTAAKTVIANVAKTVRASQAIGYDGEVMARRWDLLYPDFKTRTGTDFIKQYANWSKESNKAIKTALTVNGLQAADVETDAATRAYLESNVKSANASQSHVAAINATSQIALGQYDELQKLRQIQMAQNQAQLTYMQGQQQVSDKKAAQDDTLNKMFSKPANTRSYDELLKLSK